MKRLLIIPAVLLLICACDTTPPQPDKELYFTFYKEIMVHTKQFDDKLKPFHQSLAVKDAYQAINIATDIEDDVSNLWSKLQSVDVPNLRNKDAQKELELAKGYISSAYFNKYQALSAFVEYSKKPSPYLMAKITKDADQTKALSLLGVAGLLTAGSKLGLTMEEISAGKTIQQPAPSPTVKESVKSLDAVNELQFSGHNDNGQLKLYAVTSSIKEEQIKPILLAALERATEQYPQCQSLIIGISKNEQQAKAGQFLAKIEYIFGSTVLTIGDKQEAVQINKK